MKQASDTKNYTRGGQITLHNIRMFVQITNKVVLIASIVFLLVSSCIAWMSTSEYERYVEMEYVWSTFIPILDSDAKTDFILPNGEIVKVKYTDFREETLITNITHQVGIKLIRAMFIGLLVAIAALSGITYWLKRRGKAQTENTPIKGDEISSKEETRAKIIKAKLNSDLELAGLPLIKDAETTHFLFHGTTKSGKSNGIKELLDQIRERGDRAIIYDKSCNFLEEFYEKDKDILLNPLDVRSNPWDLWRECRDSADFDSLAAAQIPMPLSTQDPFWVNAARTIFSSVAFEMRNDPERSVHKLLRYLLTADLDLIQRYLKGTEAETLVSEKTEKTAISIKSVLATYLKSLKYVKEGESPYSIRQWVQNENANNWLFITSLGDRHETLKPLITAWLDIAVNTLLSLPTNRNRRIWVILDEIYSLHQLPYLKAFLAEAAKFGGCAVLGLQNFPQLEEVYGHKGAQAISSLLNTRIMLRQPDSDVAKWSAINLGESITEEVRESISYGANTIRDGISINRIETCKPLVSYSEIMSIANLFAYIRLPGKFPITPVNFVYNERAKRNAGFILRHIDDRRMEEVDEMIEQCEKPSILNKSASKNQKKNKEEAIISENLSLDSVDI